MKTTRSTLLLLAATIPAFGQSYFNLDWFKENKAVTLGFAGMGTLIGVLFVKNNSRGKKIDSLEKSLREERQEAQKNYLELLNQIELRDQNIKKVIIENQAKNKKKLKDAEKDIRDLKEGQQRIDINFGGMVDTFNNAITSINTFKKIYYHFTLPTLALLADPTSRNILPSQCLDPYKSLGALSEKDKLYISFASAFGPNYKRLMSDGYAPRNDINTLFEKKTDKPINENKEEIDDL